MVTTPKPWGAYTDEDVRWLMQTACIIGGIFGAAMALLTVAVLMAVL